MSDMATSCFTHQRPGRLRMHHVTTEGPQREGAPGLRPSSRGAEIDRLDSVPVLFRSVLQNLKILESEYIFDYFIKI